MAQTTLEPSAPHTASLLGSHQTVVRCGLWFGRCDYERSADQGLRCVAV